MAPNTTDATSPAEEPNSPVGDVRAMVGTAIFSNDPARLAAFYGMLLGLRFERRLHNDGREHRIAKLDAGNTPLHFEIKAARTSSGEVTPDGQGVVGSGSIEISFEVQDARAACEYAVVLGGEELLPVVEEPYGSFGSVLDPDGNRVGLYSPTSAKEGS